MTIDPSAARSGSVFSDNPNYRAFWACYINYVYTPILGFDIRYGVWQIPEFTIQLAPDPLIQRLGFEDRIPVQIFYLDHWVDPNNPELRLLVDGEIASSGFQNISGQRVRSFNCLGHMQLFEDLMFFFMNTVDDVVAAQSPEIQSTGLQTAGLFYPFSLFHTGLTVGATAGRVENQQGAAVLSAGQTGLARAQALRGGQVDVNGDDVEGVAGDVIKAPYELVYNVVVGIIGSSVPVERKTIPAMNFFARHVRKVRFHQRFVRFPVLEDVAALENRKGVFPIFNAARSSEALSAMQRQVSNGVSNAGSIWDILKQVLSLVYMDIAMLPTAPCVQTNLDGEILRILTSDADLVVQEAPPRLPSPPGEPAHTYDAQEVREKIVNDIFARIPASVAVTRAQFDEWTRGILSSSNIDLSTHYMIGALEGRVRAELPAEARTAFREAVATYQETIPNGTFNQAAVELTNRTRPEGTPPTPTPFHPPTGVSPTNPVRLAQTFVKPNLFFAVPPACNVIYPSMIDTWAGNEDYRAQPTRTYINDSVMSAALNATGAQQEFMLHALTVAYPEEADAVLHRQVGGDAAAPDRAAGAGGSPGQQLTGKDLLIWPVEYFAGPKVKKFPLPRWFQFLQQMRNTPGTEPAPTRQPTGASPAVTSGGSTGTPSGAVPASGAPAQNASFTVDRSSENSAPPDRPLTAQQQQQQNPRITLGQQGGMSVTTRGSVRVDPSQYPADTWRPSARALEVGNRTFVRADPATQEGIGSDGMPTSPTLRTRQLPPQRGASAFKRFLEANFRVYVTSVGIVRPESRSRFPGRRDQHHAGRAMDIMITPVNRRANNVYGNPIADWLVENAAVIGIQYVLWARFQWYGGNQRSGDKFGFYRYTSQPYDHLSEWHCDHIHMELNDEACELRTPWFADASVQQRIVLPSIAGNPAVLPRVRVVNTTSLPTNATRTVVRTERVTNASGAPVGSATSGNVSSGNPAPDTAPTPGSSNTVVAAVEEGEPSVEQSFQKLFRIYAQSEHLKAKYNARSGSLLLQFNPYLVPGFPLVVFDSMATRDHAVAYLVSVAHQAFAGAGQSGSIGTTASLSCVRTFPEFLQDVMNDCERFAERLVTAPAEIVDEIRDNLQKEAQAETIYRRLFYGNSLPATLKAAFSFTEAMGYQQPNSLEVDTINIDEEVQQDPPPAPPSSEHPQTGAEYLPRMREFISNVPGINAVTLAQIQAKVDDLHIENSPSFTPNDVVSALETSLSTGFSLQRAGIESLIRGLRDDVAALAGNTNPSATTDQAAGSQTITRRVTHNIDPNRELSPIPNTPYYLGFQRYDSAMQLAARPICTLTQYIRFLHGGRTVNDLIATGDVELGSNELNYSSVMENDVTSVEEVASGRPPVVNRTIAQRYTAQIYNRIARLRPGPGTPPTEGQRGYVAGQSPGPSSTREGVPADYAQTRADWDRILIAYREKIARRVSPGV